jgi:iron complex transport system substrate-binding protein
LASASAGSVYAFGPQDLRSSARSSSSCSTRTRLDAVREGRVIYMDVDGDFGNALGFSSPLSIPFALDQAVPQLAAVVKEAE